MSRSIGIPEVFGVRPDRFDHEVEFIGAVDLARYRSRPLSGGMSRALVKSYSR